jgi:hypothetical protein
MGDGGMGQGGSGLGELRVGFRKGCLRYIGVVTAGGTGMAICLGAYDVLKNQPAQSFTLLHDWGPAFLICMLLVIFGSKSLDGLVLAVRESFTSIAAAVQNQAETNGRMADASTKTADALTRLAEQGGKQFEEVRRLSIYAAQEISGVYERFDRTDAALLALASSVKGLHTKLGNEKTALDLKEAGATSEHGA